LVIGGGPLLVGSDLVVPPDTLPTGRHRAGDRHLKIHDYRDNLHPDVLHISASLELVGVDQLKRVRSANPNVRMMRAVSVDGPDSVGVAREFEAVADLLLLDTKDPGATTIGATGRTHDWALSAEIVESVRIPVILAGGLFAGNVAEAIGRVRPWGVDSYTLTSVDGDLRRKDPEKVKAFVSAVRQVGDQY
jgi:phosphoribosylanthranilate isomerase